MPDVRFAQMPVARENQTIGIRDPASGIPQRDLKIKRYLDEL
jgi:hypothetical protein